jgi:hypothetical protein
LYPDVPVRSVPDLGIKQNKGGLMSQLLLLIVSLVGILTALLVIRQKKTAYLKKRWMPDVRRVI